MFATQWKRANILPIDDKNDKQVISNYRATSLLPIGSKTFEKLISHELFKFIAVKNLLYNHQSGFDPYHVFINYIQSLMTFFQVLTAAQL